jgi:hypothetical protein
MNKSVIYWKWEDSTLDSDIVGSIHDLCSRMNAQTVFLGLHWIKRRLDDKKLLDALSLCSSELHKLGRKLVVEVCPRNEGASFSKQHPKETAYLTTASESTLDDNGRGQLVIDTGAVPHYWRIADQKKPVLLAAFTLEKWKEHKFKANSCIRSDQTVRLRELEESRTCLEVDAGREAAGSTAVVFVGIPQAIPDLASEHLAGFYGNLLDKVKGVGIDGVMSDEWGYDVILGVEKETGATEPPKKPSLYMEHITYSDNFAEYYKELTGDKLLEDLIYFYYEEEGNRQKSIKKVNAYHKAFRKIMRSNDEAMYHLAKSKLGEETFYGVHPTWWGNNYLQNFEGFKNGYYWWEAIRDIAQTDEIVIMPIRTSLSHKWGSAYWYNMWYSMGTRDIKTYYKETWNNVRFGGRTHYLSYECPNESVVLELKPQGLLERIEEMDSVVRMIDSFQMASPDCRVLILYGMENSLNWFYNDQAAPPWRPRHKILSSVLECTDQIFKHFLCDLVPTSEIENGSLKVMNGKVSYGTQDYDAVILLAPNSLNSSCFEFLSKLNVSRLIVAGEAHEYDNGLKLMDSHLKLLEKGVRIQELYSPEEIISLLKEWNISPNRFEKGCVLQDGSLIFTADGNDALHNPLSVHENYHDLTIDFEGEDMLYIHKTDGNYQVIYPVGTCSFK